MHSIDERKVLRDDALSMTHLPCRVSPSAVEVQRFDGGQPQGIARKRSNGGVQRDVERDIPIGEELAPHIIQ